jgi:hypothetical protein
MTFIDGFAPPHNGFTLTEDAVRAGAKLVRDVHDLTQGTPFGAGSEVAAHRNLSQPFETAVLEVKKEAVHVVGVRAQRSANGVTNSDDAGRRHPAEERHFVVRGHREPA